jgi:hypothetical protein
MSSMLCPHGCGVTFDKNQAQHGPKQLASVQGVIWQAISWICPGCDSITVDLRRVKVEPSGAAMAGGLPMPTQTQKQYRMWPRSSRKAPPEVPRDLARDYEEAAATLDAGPRASAAMGRRCLQQILRDHHQATGGTLEREINSVTTLPTQVCDSLHALRQIGNFAAHPVKDTSTGDIVDVEAGEAEWTLEVLEQLFDVTFVVPARTQARKAALNQKLQAAGKPPV